MAEKRVVELEVKTTGAEQSEKSVKSLKARLRELKTELQGLDEGSDQFKKLVREAGELQDTIGDLNQQVKNFASDTRRLDATLEGIGAVAGAFGAVESSLALVGIESEELQKTMVRLQAAMTLVNSVQSIANALQKESALMTGLSSIKTNLLTKATVQQAVATGTATTAQRIMNTVMKANPIGLIITGIVALTTAMYAFSKATDEATEDYGKFRESASKQVKKLSTGHDELNDKLEHEIALMKAKGATDKEIAQQELKNLSILEKDRKKRLEEALLLRYTLLSQLDYARKKGTEAEIEASKKEFDTNKETIKNLLALRIDYSRQKELLTIEANKNEIKQEKQKVDDIIDEAKRERDALNDIEEQAYLNKLAKIKEREEAYAEAVAEARKLNIESALSDEEKELLAIKNKYAKIEELGELNKDLIEAQKNEENEIIKKYIKEAQIEKDAADKESLEKEKALRDAKYQLAYDTLNLISNVGNLIINDQKKLEKFNKAAALVQIGIDTAKALSNALVTANAPTADNVLTGGLAGIAKYITLFGTITANALRAKQILSGAGSSAAPAGGGGNGGGGSTPNQVITPNFNLVGQSGANTLGMQTQPLQAYVVSGEVTSQQALDRNRLKNATFG